MNNFGAKKVAGRDGGILAEGGNIFGDKTDSIPLNFIEPTLGEYYNELGNLFPIHVGDFTTFEPLGSVGKKALSGDIDLAVDVLQLFKDGEVNPEDLPTWNLDPKKWEERVQQLAKRARTSTPIELGWKAFLQLLAEYINENSDLITVNLKKTTPGTMFSLFPQFNEQGEKQNIGVQIDWMVGNLDYLTFSYFSDVQSEDEPLLKGLHRTQLIHALILAKDHSFSHTKGVTDKQSGELVAFSRDEVLRLLSKLYGKRIFSSDTQNFNTLNDWMKEIDENDRELAFTAYLKILDRTRGNKDMGSGERCGYIPKALEQMYLSLLEKGEVSGKFICKEANPNIYAAVSGMLQEQLDNDEKITVVIPGGFKPPHKGHVEMINHFANLPNVEEVIVFMGSKPRMSADKSVVVSKDKSIELFKLFDLAPNIRFGNVTQRPKKDGSTYENPFSDAVDVLFDERFAGKKVAIGHPTKDPAYGDAFAARAKSMKKDMAADLVAVTPADTTDDLSATNLRNAVQDKDLESLAKFIPSNIVEDYLKILIGD
tara:strand:- start:1003 stop:2622 length:1620 start_codon:yes stop_codon:yes gene_type:complete